MEFLIGLRSKYLSFFPAGGLPATQGRTLVHTWSNNNSNYGIEVN